MTNNENIKGTENHLLESVSLKKFIKMGRILQFFILSMVCLCFGSKSRPTNRRFYLLNSLRQSRPSGITSEQSRIFPFSLDWFQSDKFPIANEIETFFDDINQSK